ncbi:MAG TPA: hypothetical protein VKZ87_07640 [Ferrovibrio sp.]|uniref:hypothetical protein n=1 Tax=Ferrovibrio sp. TaxID=1917215 RepID=UPI002B4AE8CA|nr:hypothetical protein [Ferrovibrio sp.]HLT77245.1 hypothetical protein [Ferrovibrio sp.]
MPQNHADTVRHGGPGSSQQNAKNPEKSAAPRPLSPSDRKEKHSNVSGGGGERDIHHTRDPRTKS